MQIISWNIQAAKGVDEIVSVERIAETTRALGDADVICFQEVLCDDEALIAGNRDQVNALAACFPDHQMFFGSGIDRLTVGGRLRFGNVALCRLPVLQCVMHKLPQPADPSIPHMPRQAIELLVGDTEGPIRIVSTHLDYFSERQRRAQVSYLSSLNRESLERAAGPMVAGGEAQFAPLPETTRSLYCGDFNLMVGSDEYQELTDVDAGAGLVDCWIRTNPDLPHAPTCGIFDRLQWTEGPHCRDFFFASEALVDRVTDMKVDVDTAASDHQPIKLTLANSRPHEALHELSLEQQKGDQ